MPQDRQAVADFVDAYLDWVGAPRAGAPGASNADLLFHQALAAYLDDLRAHRISVPLGLDEIVEALTVQAGHGVDQRATDRSAATAPRTPPRLAPPFDPYPYPGTIPPAQVVTRPSVHLTQPRTLPADSWHRDRAETEATDRPTASTAAADHRADIADPPDDL